MSFRVDRSEARGVSALRVARWEGPGLPAQAKSENGAPGPRKLTAAEDFGGAAQRARPVPGTGTGTAEKRPAAERGSLHLSVQAF